MEFSKIRWAFRMIKTIHSLTWNTALDSPKEWWAYFYSKRIRRRIYWKNMNGKLVFATAKQTPKEKVFETLKMEDIHVFVGAGETQTLKLTFFGALVFSCRRRWNPQKLPRGLGDEVGCVQHISAMFPTFPCIIYELPVWFPDPIFRRIKNVGQNIRMPLPRLTKAAGPPTPIPFKLLLCPLSLRVCVCVFFSYFNFIIIPTLFVFPPFSYLFLLLVVKVLSLALVILSYVLLPCNGMVLLLFVLCVNSMMYVSV